jgi:hypothetical protein
MNSLNKKIMEQEKELLNRRNTENDMKLDLERSKLVIKNDLDVKDKAFSNEDKRESYVCDLPIIKTKIEELKKYKYDSDMLEIDYKFNLRQLGICIHYLKQDM